MELKTACSYATVSAWVCSELAAERSGLPHTGESGSLLNRRQQFTMAKRKTSCGSARMSSRLRTNATRSASYEALPNHQHFPAKSGLTSRPVANSNVLWKSEMHLRKTKVGMLCVDRVGDRRS